MSWLKVDPNTFGDPNVAREHGLRRIPTKSARSANDYAFNLTWVPRRSVHFGLMFAQTRFKGGAGTSMAVTNRPTETLLLGRAQVNF